MNWIEALILGLLQGMTEFLPVSSSGHLELGMAFFELTEGENLTFNILVHGATFLSVVVVFRKDIIHLVREFFRFQWNMETQFITLLIVSAIPVAFVGFAFKDQIEQLFEGNIVFVGSMLLVTATLLFLTRFAPHGTKGITLKSALIIGLAQTLAILPGISRSGATISTALYLGIDKVKATRFSFLMVLIPIFGASLLELIDVASSTQTSQLSVPALVAGTIAAFLSGLLAASWMLNIVRKGKLYYFSIYCLVVGVIAIITGITG